MKQNRKCLICRALYAALFLFPVFLAAQTVTLEGIVSDMNGTPLEAVTLRLMRQSDSAFVKAELSDATGRYAFEGMSPGVYRVEAYLLGFDKQSSDVLEAAKPGESLRIPAFRLTESATMLNEVAVTAQKPFIERRNDRMIVNVENSILATGSSAMEVLERSPGVIVSAGDAISIRGRSGVIVMIDGKPNPMSGADLANYLKSLPSNSIERIEIITNPSARYDAAGNAGIIDIRLKKDKKIGTNGNFSASYAQGVYPKSGAGISLNHRNRKVNLFGSYNYGFRKGMNDLRLYREFFENGERTGAYDQRNYLVMPYNQHLARLGADFFLSPKTTVGVLGTGTLLHFKPRGENTSDVENGSGEDISAFGTSNRSRDWWPNYALNANFRHAFRPEGPELSADIDYARYWNQTDQNFTTRYYDLEGVENRPLYLLVGDLQGLLEIRSGKADYVHPLFKGKGKVEAGAKSSIVDADNDVQFFDKSDAANPVYDSTVSNHFIYRENINAAYLNFSRDWEKFSLQTGLRVENTVAEGTQLVNGQSFDRNYTNWFPSAFFTYKWTKNYEMGLNLSRRLDRPSYRQLNPFKFFLDPSTYREGNPYLNPQFTWQAEWNHTIAQRFNVSLAVSRTFDNITEVIGPVEGLDRVTVQTDQNLTEVDNISLNANVPLNFFKWWNSVNNVSVWCSQYRGLYADTPLNNGNWVGYFQSNNTFTMGHDWSAELSFQGQTSQIYGFMNLNPMWGLGMGLQKKIWQNRATLKLAATDIFWTNLPSATITYRDYVETFEVFRETRQVTVSFNYRFGNNQVAQARRRQGGAEEEKRRAGGQG